MLFRALLLALGLFVVSLPASAQSPMKAVATFSILADLLAEVAGDKVELSVVVGPDIDAHAYQPRPTDARALADAKVLVSNGLGFEGWIDRLAKAAPFKGKAIVATAGVATLKAGADHGHSHGNSHGHGPDPHCWQDVQRVRTYVANIAKGLAEADPPNAAYYRERAQAFDRRLAELDTWVKAEIAKVPADKRRAITGHDSFRYFSTAYGVKFQSPRGYNTSSEPSARDVAALIREVREHRIKALFVENMTNPGLIDQIARESGAVVGPRLYTDALSGPDGPAPTYEKMMRHNVTALVAGMAKN
ncbi:zinc ABC transporter substrate-binding protein [Reyranella sp.]|jgi:zinc/manganese transport system substrate-binding protein|uniref:metal ABC transporter solute-binding protein, Zn/Mn family n=1 Tax=Reyranella sp. TaxID=1929291 RepID=UPI000BC9D973|nr:zinc ABC transporter substrate-binding protein [Reyranella sp.]OYY41698.1 MAG: metal ABC transporter substrate-binding protein [Rhodospirillales bacterium 35-66-84]OYZ93697.1 MAG: metal ABC transporter substrate-binding protein [Rhodospirillales bacterium 24-66-33]OZB24769.1 MAG: metal ABC transporter substrate-binding protein [Rhodospirillales bacterium 39-66-50]HQS15708.1 zinc ABC transporter substrate-binding protein [Reyranella sp.]HQT12974.1 zinc ABC transporter substrate-binding prote